MIKGISASPGIAIGPAFRILKQNVVVTKKIITDSQLEWQRMLVALKTAKEQISKIITIATESLGPEQAALFEAQLLMLDDPEMLETVQSQINNEKINADYAFKNSIDRYLALLEQSDNEYLRERCADLKDIYRRVINQLTGLEYRSLAEISEPCIIVADDLLPSETAQLDCSKVLAFVTAAGGPTSHTAIMARTLGIPAVVGLAKFTEQIQNSDQIIVDGESGEVFINPPSSIVKQFQNKLTSLNKALQDLQAFKNITATTKDGVHIELAANIGKPNEVELALNNGAESIGLFRTEFLYMNHSNLPSEEEQFKAYQTVLTKMGDKPVIIRTLDIGGDKQLPYLPINDELNPFLGYRALRLCLDRPDIFKIQLRALLRAALHGHLRIMFPMVSGIEELRAAKQMVAEVRQELSQSHIPFQSDVELGIMIEIPAAAIISDVLATEADFFSIGTNDLIQYTMAVDRTNQKVASLYNPFHPAVLRLIKLIIDNAHNFGKPVGMCGEMAGDLRLLPVLLGFGIDELSMSVTTLLKAKQQLRCLDSKKCAQIAATVLKLGNASEIQEYIESTL